MRRLIVLRRVILRTRRLGPTRRTFTHESSRLSNPRPQVPFLGIPTALQQHRFLTTQRRQWLRYEVFLFFKYTVYIWIAATSVAAIAFAVNEEWLERDYPTPPEWSFLTRWRLRGAKYERDRNDVGEPRYVQMMEIYLKALERLEDPGKDGAEVRPLGDTPGEKDVPMDISAKSEEWRRGYFETLLALCQISEHIEGWMVDRKTRYVFPPEMVVGPSNPRPKPIPPGIKKHPLLENCEVAYSDPTALYGKLLGTEGLSAAQRIEAQLSYANWIEYKFRDAAQPGLPNPAELMFGDAMFEALKQTETAADQKPSQALPSQDRKAILQTAVSRLDSVPSENLLKCLTAYATYKARNGEVAAALPIFVSVLRARRALPKATVQTSLVGQGKSSGSSSSSSNSSSTSSSGGKKPSVNILEQVASSLSGWITPPQYPPPPPDGSAPPIRDASEICKEAGLMLHIGEIMYAAKDSSREEGLAWTRDAVDIAEEQLHKARQQTDAAAAAAKPTCKACLSSGLENWATMVSRLAREEGAGKTPAAVPPKTGWFGLWGDGGKGQEHEQGRWAAEEKVIQERTRRVSELLEDLEPPKTGLASILHA